MTEREFWNEALYSVTMVFIKRMLRMNLISGEDYWAVNSKMKKKYHPVSDGLISEIDLICVEKRA